MKKHTLLLFSLFFNWTISGEINPINQYEKTELKNCINFNSILKFDKTITEYKKNNPKKNKKEKKSNCSPTTGISIENITSYGGNIFWNDMSSLGAIGYEYAITTSVNPPPSGNSISTTSTLVSGLTPQTTYYLHVRTECAGNTFSDWNSITFTTTCATVTSFFENFDNVINQNIPTCWNIVGGTGTATIQNIEPISTPNHLSFFGFSDTDTVIISTPPVSNLGSGTNRIKFEMKVDFGTESTIEFGYLTNPLNENSFIPLTSFTTSSNSYNSFQFSPQIGTYSNFPAFRHIGSPSNGVFIDNIIWEQNPVCPDLTGLEVNNITDTEADFIWDDLSSNGIIGYEYSISTSTTPPLSGTITSSPIGSASSLTAETIYYIYVRTICNGNAYGSWTSKSFSTMCTPVTNFTQNFDSVNIPEFPSCWSKIGEEGFANTQAFASASSPNAIYLYGDSPTNRAVIAMQPVSNLGSGTHRIKFDLRGDIESGDNVEFGYLTDITDNSSFVVLTSFTTTSTIYENVQFTPPAGTYSNYLAFRHSGNLGLGILIDNIVWEPIPDCSDITGLVLSNITSSSVDISWDDLSGNGIEGYEYSITSTVNPPNSGTTTTILFNTFNGLNPETLYYFHIRTKCNGNNVGSWSTISFTTTCGTISSLPWIENFDSVTIPNIPTCFILENGNWTTDTTSTFNTPHSGENYLKNSSSAINENIWTPGFDLIAGVSYDFSSWIQGDGYTGWTIDYLVNSSQNFDNALTIGDQYVIPGNDNITIQPYAFIKRTFVPSSSGTYYFAIRVNQLSGTPKYVAIDDLELKTTPSCPNLSLYASNITSTSVDLFWNINSNANLGYEYILDNSFSNPNGPGIPTSLTSFSSNSLTELTTYYFHVRSICSNGIYSDWTTITFKTSISPPLNDNLCNSTLLNIGTPTGITNTLIGATSQINEPTPDCFNDGVSNSVWFHFIAPSSGSVEITTDFTGGTLENGDTEIAVYEDLNINCLDLTTLTNNILGCDQDNGNTVEYSSSLSLSGLNPGSTYYIQVDKWSTTLSSGTFGIAVTDVLPSDTFEKDKFNLYPNPVKDILNLSYISEIENIKIYNFLDQEVLNLNVNKKDVNLNLTNL